MARKAENSAAGAVPEESLPDFEAVFDNDSWEARLAQARVRREKALAERKVLPLHHPEESRAKRRKPISGSPPSKVLSDGIGEETELSLDDVLETKNLKDRLELAQKRHAQIHAAQARKAPGRNSALAGKTKADFKKAVLVAKSGVSPASSDKSVAALETAPSVLVLPNTHPAAEQPKQEPRGNRRRLAVVMLLVGLGVGAVGGLVLSRENSTLLTGLLPGGDQRFAEGATVVQPWGQENGPSDLASPAALEAHLAQGLGFSDPDVPRTQVPIGVSLGNAADWVPIATTAPGVLPGPKNAGFQPADLLGPVVAGLSAAMPSAAVFVAGPFEQQTPSKPSVVGGVEQPVSFSPVSLFPRAGVQISAEIIGDFATAPLGQSASLSMNMVQPPLTAVLNRVIPETVSTQITGRVPNTVPIGVSLVRASTASPVVRFTPVAFSIRSLEWVSDSQPHLQRSALPQYKPRNSLGRNAVPFADEPPAAPVMAAIDPATSTEVEELGFKAEDLPAHSIRVYAPSGVPGDQSDGIIARLRTVGFNVGSFKPVGFFISLDNVRFYHPADADTAIALAGLVQAEARDFTNFSPRPPLGTVELWLAGNEPKPQPRRVVRRASPSTDSDAGLRAFRDRLIQSLKKGEHLGGG